LSFDELKKNIQNAQFSWNPLLLTAQIKHEKNEVRFQVDSSFYISNGDQYSLEYPPVFDSGNLYIPSALAEELFTGLGLPVHYSFQKKKVQVKSEKSGNTPNGSLDFIMIDPGHGGKDPGAFGVSGVKEKDITFEVSRYLQNYLKKEFPLLKIYITRDRDSFIPLERRSDMANTKLKGNSFGLFISIHCNSALQKSVHGFEIFYLAQNPGSDEDRKVMMRENDIVSSGDPDIGTIESYLLNSQILAESKVLARQLNRTLMTEYGNMIVSRGVRRADFRVLRKALMPAVLLEIGYISNDHEVQVLQSEAFKKNLASSLSKGIKNFIKYRPVI